MQHGIPSGFLGVRVPKDDRITRETLQSVSLSLAIYRLHCALIRRATPLNVAAVESGIADDRPTVNLRRRGDPIDRLMKKYRAVLGSHGAALRLGRPAVRWADILFKFNSFVFVWPRSAHAPPTVRVDLRLLICAPRVQVSSQCEVCAASFPHAGIHPLFVPYRFSETDLCVAVFHSPRPLLYTHQQYKFVQLAYT